MRKDALSFILNPLGCGVGAWVGGWVGGGGGGFIRLYMNRSGLNDQLEVCLFLLFGLSLKR